VGPTSGADSHLYGGQELQAQSRRQDQLQSRRRSDCPALQRRSPHLNTAQKEKDAKMLTINNDPTAPNYQHMTLPFEGPFVFYNGRPSAGLHGNKNKSITTHALERSVTLQMWMINALGPSKKTFGPQS
jgi:hypothetical protein